MKIQGNDYNFGRVVYLTICRQDYDPALQYFNTPGLKDQGVTIVFDPKTNPQWNTRIDFWVKHSGPGTTSGSNAAFSIATIDLYNIGPALQQFMNAYNAYVDQRPSAKYDGTKPYWAESNIRKYACCLKVGYKDGPLTTIFSGYIGSYNVERKQNNSTVDNVWHLYAQYPAAQGNSTVGEKNKATSGEDYSELAKKQIQQTFVSGEELIRAAVMQFPRETYALTAAPNLPQEETFAILQQTQIPTQTKLVALPAVREINNENFDQFFKIRYQHYRTGEEYPEVKKMWQEKTPMTSWNMDYEFLQSALEEIADKKNCYAYIDKDDNTGMQTIYIYPAGLKNTPYVAQNADFVIEDFRNLRRQPGVSGSMLQLDMMMEPSVKPGDTFELTLSNKFTTRLKEANTMPSFQASTGGTMANSTTVFAGGNFLGLSNVLSSVEKSNAMAQWGNVFGNIYVSNFVVHQGSTHANDWSTQVDCSGVVLPSGEVKTI